jgi:hypothetical protein
VLSATDQRQDATEATTGSSLPLVALILRATSEAMGSSLPLVALSRCAGKGSRPPIFLSRPPIFLSCPGWALRGLTRGVTWPWPLGGHLAPPPVLPGCVEIRSL